MLSQAQKNKPLAKTPQPTKSTLKSIMAKGSQSAPTTVSKDLSIDRCYGRPRANWALYTKYTIFAAS